MNQGCISDFKRLFRDLDKAIQFQKDPLEIVKFVVLNHRFPITGYLKDNIQQYILELDDRVILTSNRFYSTRTTSQIIYVNSKKCIKSLKKCDIVKVGNIRMKVLQLANLYVDCIIVFAGILSSKSKVTFPLDCDKFDISAEEIEDIKFANDFDVNIIVTPSPGCNGYLSSLKASTTSKLQRFFTNINFENLSQEKQLKWSIYNYDGFFLNVEINEAEKRFITMDGVIIQFLKDCYYLKKPVILSGFKKKSLILKNYEHYFTCLPEKFLLQKEDTIGAGQRALEDFIKIDSSRIHCFALNQLNNFIDKSTTNSDTFAMGIVSMAYTTGSDVIILYSYSGRMPIKISHFRPFCPIVTYIHCKDKQKYAAMFYNIYTIPELDEETECEREEDRNDICELTPHKLIKALTFCSKQNLIEAASEVIVVFRSKLNKGYQNKFINFRYNHNFIESEIKDILQ